MAAAEEELTAQFALICGSEAQPTVLLRTFLVSSLHTHSASLDTAAMCYGCCCSTRRNLIAGDIPMYIQPEKDPSSGEATPAFTPSASALGAAKVAQRQRKADQREAEHAAHTASITQWIAASHDDEMITPTDDFHVGWCFRSMPCSAFAMLGVSLVAAVLPLPALAEARHPTDVLTTMFTISQFLFHITIAWVLWAYRRRPLFLPASFSTVTSVVKRQISASSSLKGRIGTADAEMAKLVRSDEWACMTQLERHLQVGWVQLQRLSPREAARYRRNVIVNSRIYMAIFLVLGVGLVATCVMFAMEDRAYLLVGSQEWPPIVNSILLPVFCLCMLVAVESPLLALFMLILQAGLFKALAHGLERAVTTGMRDLVVAHEVGAAEAALGGEAAAEANAQHRTQEWMQAVSDYHSYLARAAKRVSHVLSDVLSMLILTSAVCVVLVLMELFGGRRDKSVPQDTLLILDFVGVLFFVISPMLLVLLILTFASQVTEQFNRVVVSLANAPMSLPQAIRRTVWLEAAAALRTPTARTDATPVATTPADSGRESSSPQPPIQVTSARAAVAPAAEPLIESGASPVREPVEPLATPALHIRQPDAKAALGEAVGVQVQGMDSPTLSARQPWVPTGFAAPPESLVQLRSLIVSTMHHRQAGWYIFGVRIKAGLVVSALSFLAALASVVVQQFFL